MAEYLKIGDNYSAEFDIASFTDDDVYISINGKLRKDVMNGIQIVFDGVSGASGTYGMRATNISQQDPNFSEDFLDTFGTDTNIENGASSKSYMTEYAFNNIFISLNGVSGVTGTVRVYLNLD